MFRRVRLPAFVYHGTHAAPGQGYICLKPDPRGTEQLTWEMSSSVRLCTLGTLLDADFPTPS